MKEKGKTYFYLKTIIVILILLDYLEALHVNSAQNQINQRCLCKLEDSILYPGTLKWNCFNRALYDVPVNCFKQASKNVTELVLTKNAIEYIHNLDIATLVHLKKLLIDYNNLKFFDGTALQTIPNLKVFDATQNANLKNLSPDMFQHSKDLETVSFLSTSAQILPPLTTAKYLKSLDVRSCSLKNLPRALFAHLRSDFFLLNLLGNQIENIAADTLLPLPRKSVIHIDPQVKIWVNSTAEKTEVLEKSWIFNVNISEILKICQHHDEPKGVC